MAVIRNGEVTFKGAVIHEMSHYHYDGMEEVSVLVYDESEDKLDFVDVGYFGSDGRNLMGCEWSVDLTTDNARKAMHVIKKIAAREYEKSVQQYKSEIHKGDTVTVTRGRKVAKGTSGTVFWVGEKYNPYSHEDELIVGIKYDINDKSEKPIWVKAEYLTRTNTIKSPRPAERKKFIESHIRKYYSDVLVIAQKH